MKVTDVTIEIRSVALGRIGAIDLDDIDYIQFVKRLRNVGSWSLVLPSEADAVPLLSQPGRGIVIRGRVEDSAPSVIGGVITPAPPNYGVLFSGPVITWTKKVSAQDPDGAIEFTGSDDNIHLADALAYADPANSVAAQTQAYDVRSGVAETVARAYVAANIVSGSSQPSRAVPGVVLAPTDQGRGATVSGRARFNVLGELLADVCTAGGLGFDMTQSGTEIQFDVYVPEDKTNSVIMNIENDQLASTSYGFSAPTATRVTLAGQGEGVDRTIVQRTSAESLAAETEWGRKPELFKDRRDAETAAEMEADGDTVVAENGKIITSLSVVPADMEAEHDGYGSMDYGRDWRLGDLVKVIVDDQALTAVISEAIVTMDADGISQAATVGEPSGFDFESKIISAQGKQEKRLSSLERVAEGGAGTVTEAGDTLYFLEDEADPGIAGYKVMDNPAQLLAEAYVTQATVADSAIVQPWITDTGLPGTAFLPSGMWLFHISAFKTGGTKVTQIYNEIYKRTSGGVETLLGTTGLSIPLTDSEKILPAISAYLDAVTLDPTDRIVTKTRMRISGTGSDPTSVTLGFSGTTGARLSVPTQTLAASAAAVPEALALRDAAGRTQFADPAVAADAATKGYVDGKTWDASDLVSGILADTRIPNLNASKITAGTFDTARIPGTDAPTASTVVKRDAAGRTAFASPSASDDAATKGYVDGKTWDASDLVSGTLADARLPGRLGVATLDVSDWNLVTQNGFYKGYNKPNTPIANWVHMLVIAYASTYVKQVCYEFYGNRMWTRYQSAGVWYPWVEMAQVDMGYRLVQTLYFTASGTFSKASYPTARAIRVRLVGGGGGGGSSQAASNNYHSVGGGGGAGGYAESFILAGSVPSSVSVSIGSGGGPGGAGGTTSFGSLVSATGGLAGPTKPNSIYSWYISTAAGGEGTVGDFKTDGAPGGSGNGYAALGSAGNGGSSLLGGGAPQNGGGAGAGSYPGNHAAGYGGGGSGAQTNSNGAAASGGYGKGGIVIVEVFA